MRGRAEGMEASREAEPEATAVVTVAAASDDPDGGEYGILHWTKLLLAALGMLTEQPQTATAAGRFASVQVPRVHAAELARRFAGRGFGTHIGPALDRLAPGSVALSVWKAEGPTPAERMRALWGRVRTRDGLVLEEGYRHGVEMTDEDVRQGAWFE